MSDLDLLDAEFSPTRIKLAREIAKRHGLKMRRQWAEGSFRLRWLSKLLREWRRRYRSLLIARLLSPLA